VLLKTKALEPLHAERRHGFCVNLHGVSDASAAASIARNKAAPIRVLPDPGCKPQLREPEVVRREHRCCGARVVERGAALAPGGRFRIHEPVEKLRQHLSARAPPKRFGREIVWPENDSTRDIETYDAQVQSGPEQRLGRVWVGKAVELRDRRDVSLRQGSPHPFRAPSFARL
jgi:hypothetical protein